MARAAPYLLRGPAPGEQARQASGTCAHGSPGGGQPGQQAAMLGRWQATLQMNCTWPATRLYSVVLSWVDSPGQRQGA
jgi:hypothetical protein